ncbi:MAG: carboxypeptidase regulatory-like domain-containing protein [Theionarchaea archaeon]|nr:carboxypeptidase regulatory-like domain-containing protein [Theionarchaea archaeon]
MRPCRVSIILLSGLLLLNSLQGSGVFQVTIDPGNQVNPAIYGDIIVWEDDRNGNWDIYGYMISTRTVFQITSDESNQMEPAVQGDTVTWMDERNGNTDIFLYDLSQKQEFRITFHEANQTHPALYGNMVVWQDYRNGNWDIYGYDLPLQQEFEVTTFSGNQTHPALYGDMVVWQDYRNGNWDIYGYDLSLQQEFQITSNSRDQVAPSIYKDMVVWADDRNDNWDIYGYRVSTQQEFQITADPSNQMTPAVSENAVVWEDERNGGYDVYRYDLHLLQKDPIGVNSAFQKRPALYGNSIVWEDYRNGNWDIYGYNLPGVSQQTTLYTLSLTVADSEGNPVPRASLSLGPYAGLTDESGFARIPDIAAGTYTLIITAAGYTQYSHIIEIQQNETLSITLLPLQEQESPPVEVIIAVKDTLDRPVAGATVAVKGPSQLSDTTNERGEVGFSLIPGFYAVTISAPDYEPGFQEKEITGEETLSITLVSNLSVTIMATDSLRMPIVQAAVTLKGPVTLTGKTDTSGQVIISNVPRGTYILAVSHKAYGIYTDHAFNVSTSVNTMVTLNPEMGFLHGTVYWKTTDTLAKDIMVRIYDQATNILEKNVMTDFRGVFITEVPNTKTYYLIIEDFAEQTFYDIYPVPSLDQGAVTLIIDPQCGISGVITDEVGDPVPGVPVTVKPVHNGQVTQGLSSTSGAFIIDVVPGTYILEVSLTGYQSISETVEVYSGKISALDSLRLETKEIPRIDAQDDDMGSINKEPSSTTSPLLLPVLITLGVCVIVVVAVIIRSKNRSDLMTTTIISVFTGIMAIILMWILFQIG